MVEGHVPQGVEVQVLSSAQVYRMKNPRFGDFLLPEELNSKGFLPFKTFAPGNKKLSHDAMFTPAKP
jgi:hypothetical protein